VRIFEAIELQSRLESIEQQMTEAANRN
jgi:hypothetical protein